MKKHIKSIRPGKRALLSRVGIFFFVMALTFVMLEHLLAAKITTNVSANSQTFVVSGMVIKKEERWNRRSNPQMGRPDILKEILFHIHVDSVVKGKIPGNSNSITVSVRGQKELLKYKTINEGNEGTFTLSGEAMPFFLIEATLFTRVDGSSKTDEEFLNSIEKISGKEIQESKALQKRAARVIARKYNMQNAEVTILVSFSGPRPPKGGYIYWGVRGQIDGKWYVWQPWTNWILRPGKQLEDPKRYQK